MTRAIHAWYCDVQAALIEIECGLGSLSLEDAYLAATEYRARASYLRFGSLRVTISVDSTNATKSISKFQRLLLKHMRRKPTL